MRAVGVIFFLAVFTLVIFAVSRLATPEQHTQLMPFMLGPCMVAYWTFLYLDIRSTVSRGRTAVGLLEASPLFRYSTRMWGFSVAVPLQVAFESVLAMIVVPYFIARSFDVPIMAAAIAIFAVIHCIAWRINSRPRCGTVKNAKNT